MRWREGPVPNWHLAGLAILAVIVFWAAEKTATKVQQPRYRTKMKAAETDLMAQQAIREEMRRHGIDIDLRNDPWETGLIGEERTIITSDRGVSTAKVLATNPNFAAAFVELLHRARVHKGDYVAIGMTGSMPGLNIAMLSACQAIGAKPVVISSVGASDWGANRPDLTWVDMERVLNENHVLPYKSVAASLGGGGDYGRGLSPEGREAIRQALIRNEIPLIENRTLEGNIEERIKYFEREAPPDGYAAYINIGGGLASLGGTANNRLIPSGYSRRLPVANYPVRAVINRMSEGHVPIINLTHVMKIAEHYGLPTVVGPDAPEVGQGSLYYKGRYNISTTAVLTIVLAFIVFVVIRLDLKHYLGRRPRESAGSATPEEAI